MDFQYGTLRFFNPHKMYGFVEVEGSADVCLIFNKGRRLGLDENGEICFLDLETTQEKGLRHPKRGDEIIFLPEEGSGGKILTAVWGFARAVEVLLAKAPKNRE